MSTFRPDETYLLEGLRAGDPVVFRLIYRLYWQKLYNMAYYYLSNETDAEDIVQDVFISLWSRRERVQIKVALENYLVRSTKYTAFFYLKLKKKYKESLQAAPSLAVSNNTEEQVNYKSLLEQLLAVFESTSQKTKEIFYLNRFSGLTYKEIAEQLQISVKTVEYHISQALKLIIANGLR